LTAATLYIDRDRGLQHLHPLTKLVISLFLIVLAIVLPSIWAGYLVFLLGVVPLALWGGILRPLWSALWKIVLPFAISMFIIQGLFWTDGTPVLALGPLSLKAEGLVFATRITGRLLAIMGSFLLISLGTPPDDLMITLEERGIPNSITYIILSAIQLVPGLPKTRSGKIMRRILRSIAAGEYEGLGDTSTLADPEVVARLIEEHRRAAGG
jgi:energy-coupling factor transporter transmembrane protein EcfT